MQLFDRHISSQRPLLIVEDNPVDQELYKQLLLQEEKDQGVVVVVASCEQALDFLNQKIPCCCLVDYHLGDKSGLEFLKGVRSHEHAEYLPVIVMTGEGDERIAVEIMRNGAQDYLVKADITREKLLRSIMSAMTACEMQNQLHYLAHYDALTGLLSRSLFVDRVKTAMTKADRYHYGCALLFADVDNFKLVNDQYGHQAGDVVLKAVAECLKQNCRLSDNTARFGGDEFAILLDCIDEDQVLKVAEKIQAAVQQPIIFQGKELFVSLSIGVTYYPKTATTVEELFKQADEAMYCIKHSGKSGYFYFSQEVDQEYRRRKQLEQLLPKSLKNGDLDLAYQPIINSTNFSLQGLEVLSRWRLADFDMSATELIDLVERLNLFDEFHDWLISTAFQQCAEFQLMDSNIHCYLNIPANHAHSKWLMQCLNRAFDTYHIDPPKIALEITETALMTQPELSSQVLTRLQDKGVQIAIDDFGTGYSSMAYLTTLPLDILKIDQFFVQHVDTDSRSRKIVEGITTLGHSLGLKVVAEGIETEEQSRVVREIGCDLLQGFYFSQPKIVDNGDFSVFAPYIINYQYSNRRKQSLTL